MDYSPQAVLTEIGLTRTEAEIYLALLGLKRAKVKTISQKTGIHRRNAYDALEKLMEKGLVASAVTSSVKYFEATNPERILSLVKEKEEMVKKWLPKLAHEYAVESTTDEALVFKGIGGIKSILQDMLEVGEDLYLIGSKGYWKTLPELKFFFPKFDKERVKRRIKIRQIYDYELKGRRITKFELGECRFFPKEYSTPIHVWIYGNRVISLFYADEPTAFMVKSQKIADGFKKYFNVMWRAARK